MFGVSSRTKGSLSEKGRVGEASGADGQRWLQWRRSSRASRGEWVVKRRMSAMFWPDVPITLKRDEMRDEERKRMW